jgi:hypothetical protein
MSPTAYFSDPLAAVVNGIAPTSSTAPETYTLSAATFHHYQTANCHQPPPQSPIANFDRN